MIQVDALTKTFGRFTAVNQLSFKAEKGDVLGFLGPNGAGKSTTMKMITGYLSPTSGSIKLNTLAGQKDPRYAIGYLPEGAPIYADMTVRHFLEFIAGVRGFAGRQKNYAVDRVIALLQLEAAEAQLIETLSKGFTRRVGLAQALIHDPEILILDEPTDGLDPNQKHHVRELIRSFADRKLVIVSTHILEEVTAVCNRAMIIAHGALKFDGTPRELASMSTEAKSIQVAFNNISQVSREDLRKIPTVVDVVALPTSHESGCQWQLYSSQPDQFFNHFQQSAKENNWSLASLSHLPGRLDDVFRQLTTSEAERTKDVSSAGVADS